MNRIKKIFNYLGPGFTTGAADDDPSAIVTFCQAGAQFGYLQLWSALFILPFMIIVQEICGRIGLVTGKGLASVIRQHYNRPILACLIVMLLGVNMINIGANLGAMANCVELLSSIPFAFALFGIALFSLLLQIVVPYKTYSKYLKYLAFALLSYIVTAFMVKQDWSKIVYSTFVPTITYSKEYLMNIAAILGTAISPYLFFWQAGQEIEEEIKNHHMSQIGEKRPIVDKKKLSRMRWNTIIGMFFSNVIMWFIIITTASTLHANNISDIQTAEQAAQALKPLAGDFAYLLFAMGIIGTGLLALPVLSSSAAYSICETFKWKEGLNKKWKHAPAFYLVIIFATTIGLLTNFLDIKPFQMLYYTAVLNGISAPPLLIMIWLIANNKKIMKRRTNSLFSNALLWIIMGIMTFIAVAFILQLIRN